MPTPEEIDAARTPAGGWTRHQLALWGIPWPPPKGWKKQLERTGHSHRRCTEYTCTHMPGFDPILGVPPNRRTKPPR